MDKIKELVANNKKLVAAILILLVGLVGVKLAPETADSLSDAIVKVCCTPAPVTPPPAQPAP